MGFMDFFKKKNSGNVAKDRLKLLLISDRADCSPDVMVADVPMYPRIVSSARAMAASNRLSKSATAPPVIAFWPGRALSFRLPHRQRHETPFPAAQMPQVHPAWREVHQYAASPVPRP